MGGGFVDVGVVVVVHDDSRVVVGVAAVAAVEAVAAVTVVAAVAVAASVVVVGSAQTRVADRCVVVGLL